MQRHPFLSLLFRLGFRPSAGRKEGGGEGVADFPLLFRRPRPPRHSLASYLRQLPYFLNGQTGDFRYEPGVHIFRQHRLRHFGLALGQSLGSAF